mgnify:CR=1 FL=1
MKTARVDPIPAPLPANIPPPQALADATVVLTLTDPIGDADVWVDGVKVGKRKGGRPADWIGAESNPLRLKPGRHTIRLTSPYMEDWQEEVQLSEGEPRTLTPPLRRAKVVISINPLIPEACSLTVGSVSYGALGASNRTIQIREPDGMDAVFVCPAPLGTFTSTIKGTVPGGTYILPPALPPAGP